MCYVKHFCCLWSRAISMGPRRKQQNLLRKALLLPLTKSDFYGSSAEAAKSCYVKHFCCLWSRAILWVPIGSSKILLRKARLLPLAKSDFKGSSAEAAKSCYVRHFCCLWSRCVSMGTWQRQQKSSIWTWRLPLTWRKAQLQWSEDKSITKIRPPWPDSCLNYAWATASIIILKSF